MLDFVSEELTKRAVPSYIFLIVHLPLNRGIFAQPNFFMTLLPTVSRFSPLVSCNIIPTSISNKTENNYKDNQLLVTDS